MRGEIQQLFNQFIHECEFSRRLRPETLRGYKETFRLFIKLLPGTSLGTINQQHMIKFFQMLEERQRIVGKGILKIGVKKSTVATYRSKLNTFFDWLTKNQHLAINPFSTMEYPSVTYDDRKFLSREEVEKIIAAIHTHHNHNLLILKRNLLMFYFLLFCGLRREELLLMQIRDIDLERKIVTIRAETSKSQRVRRLPLHPEIIFRLKDYLAARNKYSTAYLFVSSTKDKKLSYDGMKHIVQSLIKSSGIRFHLHQFRHTFAMNYLKQSNNIFKLKELLGHKDIKMTAIYLRQLPTDELREDIENLKIDNLI